MLLGLLALTLTRCRLLRLLAPALHFLTVAAVDLMWVWLITDSLVRVRHGAV
jgi:hypothetical protein